MINMSQVASLAKLLFPSKAGVIDQAVGMAQQFTPSKDGVAQLMAQQGKRKQDLQAAISMLDNPIAKGIMSRVPGLENALRGAASAMQDTPAPNPPASNMGPTNQQPASPSIGGSLAARLAALK